MLEQQRDEATVKLILHHERGKNTRGKRTIVFRSNKPPVAAQQFRTCVT